MRNIQITKNKFGFAYKDNPVTAWKNFPDGVTDIRTMLQFFMQGNYNKPQLNFVDATGNPIKYYQIKRGQNFAIADFDGDKKIIFDHRQDESEFLKDYVSDEILNDSEKIIELDSRIEFFKQNVSPETLSDLETLIAKKKSDEGLADICKAHAKHYFNMDAKVEFND
jgi:hypothetical protein